RPGSRVSARGSPMTFVDLAIGDSVFIDANTFVFYFAAHAGYGPLCGQLLQRVENRELRGFTSTHVLGEVAHRLMIAEATASAGWSPGKVRQRLKKHPAVLQGLTQFRTAVDSVLHSQVHVLAISPGLVG